MIVSPAATEEETAAIAAAIEQFVVETMPPSVPQEKVEPWLKQAMYEATGQAGRGVDFGPF